MATGPRDSQRSKVYKAEDEAFNGTRWDATLTASEADRFARAIVGHPYWTKLCRSWAPHVNERSLEVRFSRGRGAHAGYNRITLGRMALKAWIICHELAHVACPPNVGLQIQSHGGDFVSTYLRLVERFLSFDAALALQSSFSKQRVRWGSDREHAVKIRERTAAKLIRRVGGRIRMDVIIHFPPGAGASLEELKPLLAQIQQAGCTTKVLFEKLLDPKA